MSLVFHIVSVTVFNVENTLKILSFQSDFLCLFLFVFHEIFMMVFLTYIISLFLRMFPVSSSEVNIKMKRATFGNFWESRRKNAVENILETEDALKIN